MGSRAFPQCSASCTLSPTYPWKLDLSSAGGELSSSSRGLASELSSPRPWGPQGPGVPKAQGPQGPMGPQGPTLGSHGLPNMGSHGPPPKIHPKIRFYMDFLEKYIPKYDF